MRNHQPVSGLHLALAEWSLNPCQSAEAVHHKFPVPVLRNPGEERIDSPQSREELVLVLESERELGVLTFPDRKSSLCKKSLEVGCGVRGVLVDRHKVLNVQHVRRPLAA